MPLRLNIKKKLTSRSERVKCVDFHSIEPWVLSALYSGSLMIWNYDTQTLVKTIEVCNLPVRNAKFVVRKQWIIATSDDMMIRIFNYNTMEKVTGFEAHTDYIRYLEVHPTLPCVLSCADDMVIKLWDWEKNWNCTQVFEGHGYYVMMVKFNPKDTNTFASASLDRTVRVWGLGSSHAHFTLDGHERGVNCLDYYPGGDKPYLLSGSDDRTVKIWDYQTKAVIHTFDGHGNNLTSVLYHPRLPLILSASEDGTVRMWHSTTYRAETTLNYGMERAWALASLSTANKVAIGYDTGTMVIRLGHETPIVSMDSSGKLIYANNNELVTANIKGIVTELNLQDGEKIPLPTRDLGSCEVYPQKIQHNSNGRFVAVCGDSEYIIYTSQQLRNKAFGTALDFVWSPLGTGDYVVRESVSKIALYKNFKEFKTEKPRVCSAEGIFGGSGALGLKGNDCVTFYDWEELRLIRKIDVAVKNVFWSDSGNLIVIACESSYYVLAFHKEQVREAFVNGNHTSEEGVDGAFELLHEISERVCTGTWVSDCFIYTNSSKRLNYYVGGEVVTLSHLEQKLYILNYIAKENLLYFMDKMKNVYSHTILLVMLEYQTAVVRKDFDTANQILPRIPQDQIDTVARFLESQNYKEEALTLSTDPDQRFELAVQLAKLDVAKDIMLNEIESNRAGPELSVEMQHKWKQLGDLALNDFQFDLAEECALRADDYSLLMVLYSSKGDFVNMNQLATWAQQKRRFNIAFICRLLLNQTEECVSLLMDTNRIPEAAFFARSYCPSRIDSVLKVWREHLSEVSSRAAKALADPTVNMELFENIETAMCAEKRLEESVAPLAKDYEMWQSLLNSAALEDLLVEVESAGHGGSRVKWGGDVGLGGESVCRAGVDLDAVSLEMNVGHCEERAVFVEGNDIEDGADGEGLSGEVVYDSMGGQHIEALRRDEPIEFNFVDDDPVSNEPIRFVSGSDASLIKPMGYMNLDQGPPSEPMGFMDQSPPSKLMDFTGLDQGPPSEPMGFTGLDQGPPSMPMRFMRSDETPQSEPMAFVNRQEDSFNEPIGIPPTFETTSSYEPMELHSSQSQPTNGPIESAPESPPPSHEPISTNVPSHEPIKLDSPPPSGPTTFIPAPDVTPLENPLLTEITADIPPSVTNTLLDFELSTEELDFDDADDLDWGEM